MSGGPVSGRSAAPTQIEAVFTADGARRGAARLAPLCLFALPFGVAFGASAVAAGLQIDQVLTMSALVFAGAAQFAALELFPPSPPFASLAILVLVVNARHVIFGAALAPWVNQLEPWRRRAVLAVLTDANFADGYRAMRTGERDVAVVLGGGVAMWGAWMVGTAAGAVAGASIGPLERFGVDIVMATFFAALLVADLDGRLRSAASLRRAVAPVLGPVAVGAVTAAATLDALPVGWNLIAAAAAGGAVALLVDIWRGAPAPDNDGR